MAASSVKFLGRCRALSEKGFGFEFQQGAVIARGFADLGYEEFALLSSDKIVSLYTGQASFINSDDYKHFFLVPSCDQLVDRITKLGYDIMSLDFHNQRTWRVAVKHEKEDAQHIFEDATLAEVLIECLGQILLIEKQKELTQKNVTI